MNYRITPLARTLIFKLFFLMLSSVLIFSQCSIASAVPRIIVDPGHGGIDFGARVGKVKEKNTVLTISKKLKIYLNQEGYKVTLTRKRDTSLAQLSNEGNTNERRSLHARVNIINSSKARLFVSIHVNCDLKNPGANGSIVYYNGKIYESQKLAIAIQKELNNIKIRNKKRTFHEPEKSKFFILKYSNLPGVLVETAFMSNKTERKFLLKETFNDKNCSSYS